VEQLRPHWRRDPGLPARLSAWLAGHRAGSRDRRLYRELAYTAWRILPWIEHAPPDEVVGIVAACARVEPATAAFIEAFRIDPLPEHCDPDQLLPAWLVSECPAALAPEQRTALLQRAPLWIRLRHPDDAEPVRTEFAARAWSAEILPSLPTAWKLAGDVDLTTTRAFAEGRFEIQDLGSQLLLEWVQPAHGSRWLDACAGAGGKSLQLAAQLGPTGTVFCHDVRRPALQELERRAHRAGITTIRVLPESPAKGETFDGVLVDAPCTGSGTWRRAPHLKWTTGPGQIARAAERQRQLLGQFARHVRPGGRLVYATCSLCRSENESVVEAFLQTCPDFQVERLPPTGGGRLGAFGLTLLPGDLDTDGFFVSALRRAG
jgi:16S rRNA (cytosine967-C5)-methyltransferase